MNIHIDIISIHELVNLFLYNMNRGTLGTYFSVAMAFQEFNLFKSMLESPMYRDRILQCSFLSLNFYSLFVLSSQSVVLGCDSVF